MQPEYKWLEASASAQGSNGENEWNVGNKKLRSWF